jgi:hypothetical protein
LQQILVNYLSNAFICQPHEAARLYCELRAGGADPDTAAHSTRAAMENAAPQPGGTITRR